MWTIRAHLRVVQVKRVSLLTLKSSRGAFSPVTEGIGGINRPFVRAAVPVRNWSF